MGAIILNREKIIACIFTLSLAALLLFNFPADPAGFATAKVQSRENIRTSDAGPDAAQELQECSKQLTLEKSYVGELVDIVLNKCDAPRHDFESAALDIALKNSYSEKGFNCVYYSEILTSKLEGMGYKARIVNGLYKGEPHSWVVMEVPIEATSGNLITPQYYSYYNETQ